MWLVLFLLAPVSSPSNAQEPLLRFSHIPPEESFATSYIIHTTQDQQGFMWFASIVGGIARYDGYEFKTYRYDPGDPDSLPSNEGHYVYPDPTGGIWMATIDGLAWLDPETDRLTIYQHQEDNEGSLIDSNVTIVFRDSHEVLWVGTISGLSRLDRGSSRFVNYELLPEDGESSGIMPPNWVWEIYEDSRGNLWFGTIGGGLLRYQRETDSFMRFPPDEDDPTKLFRGEVRTVFEDSAGTLWVGTDAELMIMVDRENGIFKHVPLPSPEPSVRGDGPAVNDIVEDHNGNLWLSVSAGGMVKLAGTDQFRTFGHDARDGTSLGPGRPWAYFVDQGGTLWVGTDVINWLVPTTLAFSLYPAPKTLVNVELSIKMDSEGIIWVPNSKGQGLLSFDRENDEWRDYQPFADEPGEDSNWVRGAGAYESPDGRLWVVAAGSLNLLDRATGTFTSVDLPAAPFSLFIAPDRLIWMALPFHGLASLNFENGELQYYQHDPEDETTVSHDFGSVVIEDQSGWIWYGNMGGLDRFERSSGKVKRFIHDRTKPTSISNSVIQSAFEDGSGRLWIGTAFGLNRYEPQEEAFVRYYNGDSPSQNVIYDIIQAGESYLWLATDAGIARFDIEHGTFENWTAVDGIPGGWIGQLELDSEGQLYGLIPGGIVKIDPARLEAPSFPPPIAMTDFRIENHSVTVSVPGKPTQLTRPINHAESLTLSHRDQMVSFGFSALDFRAPASNRFAYRLEGLQEDWIESDANQRIATFTNLPAGKYTLRIRGANKDGVWNEAGIGLPITVLPPPWRTWWAYLLYAGAALTLLYTFINWRTRSHRVRAAELEVAVQERTVQLQESEATVRKQSQDLQSLLSLKERLFSNISHEFRTPITLMLGPIQHAIDATGNPVVAGQLIMARRNGRRVLRLVDQLLELSRLSSEKALEKAPQPVAPVGISVVEAFRELTRKRGVSLSLVADESLWTEMPAEALERVLMNLLSNAVKYTDSEGSIKVKIEPEESGEFVLVRVSDTGTGIPTERQHEIFERFRRVDSHGERIPGSGIGLALVQELVEAYDGAVAVQSVPGQGSEFIVSIPRLEPPAGLRVTHNAPVSEALQLEIDSLEKPDIEESSESLDGNTDQPQVLVIEDNQDMRSYLSQLLSAEYRVANADSGEAGLQAAEEQVPDLVICDLMLPGVDGFEVVHELRANEKTSHIPIIMLTARSDHESRLEGLRERVDDYLIKPFNDEELILRVANLLAIRDILRARFGGALVAGEEPRDSLREPERRFLEKLQGVLETHYSNEEFSITSMASDMAMSERQLQRKLKAITDQTPALYLRLFRLRRSLKLLADGRRVSDVSYDVGFSSPAYFANCFRAQFGCTPREYQAEPSRGQV